MFLTSHVLEVVERLCDRLAIINHGKMVVEGTMSELRTQSHRTSRNLGRHLRSAGGSGPQPHRETKLAVTRMMASQINAIVWTSSG